VPSEKDLSTRKTKIESKKANIESPKMYLVLGWVSAYWSSQKRGPFGEGDVGGGKGKIGTLVKRKTQRKENCDEAEEEGGRVVL